MGIMPSEAILLLREKPDNLLLATMVCCQLVAIAGNLYTRHVVKKIPEIHARRVYDGEQKDFSQLAQAHY